MNTATITYQSNLRTSCQHVKSGATFITDAPTDNNGNGEAFSPTDTIASALGSGMLTVMGIKAKTMEGVTIEGATALVTKTMSSNPRRISKIEVVLKFPVKLESKTQKILENTGNTCPVHYSIHPDIEKVITYHCGI